MSPVRSRIAALFVAVFAAALLTAGCDTTSTTPESQVVVEAYLQAEEPLDPIRLTRSVTVSSAYDPASAAVRDADVVVRRLGAGGAPVETYDTEERRPGVYAPAGSVHIRPETTYQLVATTDEGAEITATTTVPDTVEVVRVENRQAEYQGANQPALTVTAPRSAREEQSVLVLTTTSLLDFEDTPAKELRAQLTPPYSRNYDPEEDSLSTFRVTSSGLLNEENFDRTPDGNLEIRLPWLSVAFFGPNEVAAHVVDDNLFDFIRSQQVQQGGPGGGGLAPGEIPNVIEHVKGGTGIFGSYAQARQRVEIQRSNP